MWRSRSAQERTLEGSGCSLSQSFPVQRNSQTSRISNVLEANFDNCDLPKSSGFSRPLPVERKSRMAFPVKSNSQTSRMSNAPEENRDDFTLPKSSGVSRPLPVERKSRMTDSAELALRKSRITGRPNEPESHCEHFQYPHRSLCFSPECGVFASRGNAILANLLDLPYRYRSRLFGCILREPNCG